MLLEYSFGNYLSFKEPVTLSMVAMKSFKELEETNVIETDSGLKLLKSAVMYGNNGSGKSNLVNSVFFMKKLVIGSFRDALLEEEERKFPLVKFLLNSESDTVPAEFETVFIADGIKYRYGFEIEAEEIVSEWLFHTTSKEVPLFTREKEAFYINKSSFGEGLKFKKNTKDNVLFLTYLAHNNGEISNRIVNWFKDLNVISGLQDVSYKTYTVSRLKEDAEFGKWVNAFIEFLEISRITTTEEEFSEIDIEKLRAQEKDEELVNLLSSVQKIQARQPKKDHLITWHKRYNKDNLLTDTVPFNFETQESEGTKKLIHLLGPVYNTLKNGKVLFVDELDSRLHTNLIKHLITFFHRHNHTRAQLISAVHDTSILSKDIFRRDQIWFIEKDQFGASGLYSLGDFKSARVRNKSAFNKNYVQGKYGAIPYFAENEKLTELLYGEE